jgi:hypothetical protein
VMNSGSAVTSEFCCDEPRDEWRFLGCSSLTGAVSQA